MKLKVGYSPPWIDYYAEMNGKLVGSAAFNGAIEIAYGTMETHRNKGVGAEICKKPVKLSLSTDLPVRIIARTLPENNFSTRILRKNNFMLLGTVNDPEDGDVWEWEHKKEFR